MFVFAFFWVVFLLFYHGKSPLNPVFCSDSTMGFITIKRTIFFGKIFRFQVFAGFPNFQFVTRKVVRRHILAPEKHAVRIHSHGWLEPVAVALKPFWKFHPRKIGDSMNSPILTMTHMFSNGLVSPNHQG